MTDQWYMTCQSYNRQKTCRHLKASRANGTPIGPAPGSSHDYNVAMHTFIDASQKIWCMCGCGWHVWNKPEWRFKWAVGIKMIKNSTNWPSSSEIASEFTSRIKNVASKRESIE